VTESKRELSQQELDKLKAETEEILARTQREEEKHQRESEKADSLTEKNKAEARRANAEAAAAEYRAEEAHIDLEREKLRRELELASDWHHRVYRFSDPIKDDTVSKCIATLSNWNRIDPKCDMTIVFYSPGGGVVSGFGLFDFLTELKEDGHHLTTVSRGMAASMAAVLLQAGQTRIMGPQASLLIHEGSFGAIGSAGEVEDTVKWANKLRDRILEVLAERSNLSRAQIKNRWHRTDWWLMSDEALKYGFCDAVGGGGVV
jgi:ATP-dependent Clp endopeptidase proteolytic subunit ClpP